LDIARVAVFQDCFWCLLWLDFLAGRTWINTLGTACLVGLGCFRLHRRHPSWSPWSFCLVTRGQTAYQCWWHNEDCPFPVGEASFQGHSLFSMPDCLNTLKTGTVKTNSHLKRSFSKTCLPKVEKCKMILHVSHMRWPVLSGEAFDVGELWISQGIKRWDRGSRKERSLYKLADSLEMVPDQLAFTHCNGTCPVC
jgi:hypothetical protein